jgi:hypothetical protein
MDNYRCYLSAKVQIFKPPRQDFFSNIVYSSGASISLRDGDLDGAPLVMVTLRMVSPMFFACPVSCINSGS